MRGERGIKKEKETAEVEVNSNIKIKNKERKPKKPKKTKAMDWHTKKSEKAHEGKKTVPNMLAQVSEPPGATCLIAQDHRQAWALQPHHGCSNRGLVSTPLSQNRSDMLSIHKPYGESKLLISLTK